MEDPTIKHLSGKDIFTKLKKDWEAITGNEKHTRFYHYHGWAESVSELLDSQCDNIHAFVVYHGPQVLAICLLIEKERKASGITVKCLELPKHSHVPFADFVMRRTGKSSEVLKLLLPFLQKCREIKWDILCLSPVEEDSNVSYCLRNHTPKRSLILEVGYSNYIKCKNAEVISKRVCTRLKRNLRSCSNKIKAYGDVSFLKFDQKDEIADNFLHFVDVESAGWKGGSGSKTAIKCCPDALVFYNNIIEKLGGIGKCELLFLALNNKAIAAQFVLRSDSSADIIKIGYNEEYKKFSPGNLLMEWVISKFSEEAGIESVCLVGDATWQREWRPSQKAVKEVLIFNNSIKGLVAFNLKKARALGRKFLAIAGKPKLQPYAE